jgi:hypothetical protein
MRLSIRYTIIVAGRFVTDIVSNGPAATATTSNEFPDAIQFDRTEAMRLARLLRRSAGSVRVVRDYGLAEEQTVCTL